MTAPRIHDLGEQLVSAQDHVALERLVTELSWRIDHGEADTVWELFVPEGRLETGPNPLTGHEALREWGERRVAQSVVTRHICSGMRFVESGPNTAQGTTLLTVFMEPSGAIGSSTPAVVGEDLDEFVRTPRGWLFTSRVFTPLFLGR